ncbi:DUF896 domain-containing protein [Acetilactobacillus jinshanensis]|uniref:UPF0291 protein ELX58_01975 n=1 Tax=Acetilactobacillus jinshanensis TaxID=1720083 RepID=A0A4P6ZL16_9LACO|nr:DUF896 domain-containing protein [Acetilactobacillus jinshanensis]QBP17940.1 DUF896 domain-containing protein [Acetilactobacillus jinshanensis]URL60803.1 DUF896 domain-containing protein [uncultured bacterium]
MSDKYLDSLLPRINQLAEIEKKRNLTSSEKKEQKHLRLKYITRFRANLRSRLIHTKFIDQNGNDVTSDKVKKIQREHGWRK